MTLTVYAKEAQSVTETLQRTSGTGATLQVLGNDVLRDPAGPWQVIIGNLGDGRLCTPTTYTYNGSFRDSFPLPSQHVTHPLFPTVSPGAPAYSSVSGSGILYVKFCWPADAPVEFRGPYLSADWPPGPDIDEFETNPQLSSVERVLVLGAGDDTANYAFQSPVVPNSSAQNQWEWDMSAADNIRVAAINISANQNETYRTFLSGIAFGVAGGVVVTLLQELVTPFNRRRDAKIGE